MQREQNRFEDFKNTLNMIDNLFHIKQFKSISQSKIVHLKDQTKFHPKDYYLQMRKLILHMIYLYYVAYQKNINFYLYPHYCINKWGVIFRYYSLNQSSHKFMDLIHHTDFKDNVRKIFIDIWNIKKSEEQQLEKKVEQAGEQFFNQLHNKKILKNPWTDFADSFVQIFEQSDSDETTPKEILYKLQQTKHIKDNILIVGILSSAIFPCIKFNKIVGENFSQMYQEEPSIINKIFNQLYEPEGVRDFVKSLIRFLKILNDYKILGITTTMSDKIETKTIPQISLLTEFFLTLGRSTIQKHQSQKVPEMADENAFTSNKSSQNDYNQKSETKHLGQLKCQYYWSKRIKPRQLIFRVKISLYKKICPLYFSEIENIWNRLEVKWKTILEKNMELSDFNPCSISLSYNEDTYQISFNQEIKCQPFQNSLSQLILKTDKLIIASLAMKEVICYYEKKSFTVKLVEQDLIINDGRLQDLALSVCYSIKNYYKLYRQVIDSIENNKYIQGSL